MSTLVEEQSTMAAAPSCNDNRSALPVNNNVTDIGIASSPGTVNDHGALLTTTELNDARRAVNTNDNDDRASTAATPDMDDDAAGSTSSIDSGTRVSASSSSEGCVNNGGASEKGAQLDSRRDSATSTGTPNALPTVGSRVHVTVAGDVAGNRQRARATVRFVGEMHMAAGLWIGVELDADGTTPPVAGRNDGCVDGRRYFKTSLPRTGLFVRPDRVVSREMLDARRRLNNAPGGSSATKTMPAVNGRPQKTPASLRATPAISNATARATPTRTPLSSVAPSPDASLTPRASGIGGRGKATTPGTNKKNRHRNR